MYPFSFTDCSVGRFMRNFISLVRTLFGSVSPAELDEWLMLGLVAATREDHLETRAVVEALFRQPGQNGDIGGVTHACVCPRCFRTCLLALHPERRSSRTSRHPPRRSGAPDTPEEQQQRLVQATGPTAHVWQQNLSFISSKSNQQHSNFFLLTTFLTENIKFIFLQVKLELFLCKFGYFEAF